LGQALEWWRRVAVFRQETLRAVVQGHHSWWELMTVLGFVQPDGPVLTKGPEDVAREVDRLRLVEGRLEDALTPRPKADWDEDDGPCLWWVFPIVEPPYCGDPLTEDFPDYVTHWTPLLVPERPGGP
jgi:hypothetical protein